MHTPPTELTQLATRACLPLACAAQVLGTARNAGLVLVSTHSIDGTVDMRQGMAGVLDSLTGLRARFGGYAPRLVGAVSDVCGVIVHFELEPLPPHSLRHSRPAHLIATKIRQANVKAEILMPEDPREDDPPNWSAATSQGEYLPGAKLCGLLPHSSSMTCRLME